MADDPDAAPRPAGKLRTLLNDAWIPQAICAAAALGIPDLLARGPASADELAGEARAHAPSLRRLLSALVTVEIVRELDDGRFALTPMGALLRADAEESLHARALWVGRYQWPLWGRLVDCVRSGDSARKLLFGTEGFAHLAQDPEQAALFDRAMDELTRAVVPQIARSYDFSRMRTIVDLGGGYGQLLTAILAANPRLHGVLFDLAHAADEGRHRIARAGLTDRCAIVTGDFFASVPCGADAYLLKSVIHDWDDPHAATILGNVHRAMRQSTRLLLVERIMPVRLGVTAADCAIAGRDLNMLVSLGAKERTEAEFRALLARADFHLMRILPVASDFYILEARPDTRAGSP